MLGSSKLNEKGSCSIGEPSLGNTTMKKFALIIAAGSVAATAIPAQAFNVPAAPAPVVGSYSDAASPYADVANYDRRWDDRRDRDDRRYDDRGRYDDRRYDDRRYEDRRGDTWRGEDGRWRCRRADGTTGLIVGAGVGALLGRTIDRRGDRTLGTVLGAIGGGLLGREVERGGNRCR